jgi:hypothetical protein
MKKENKIDRAREEGGGEKEMRDGRRVSVLAMHLMPRSLSFWPTQIFIILLRMETLQLV